MYNKLFRKYNQNRHTVWTVIISIALFVFLLQAIFALIRANRDREQEERLNANRNVIFNNTSSIGNNNSGQYSNVITQPSGGTSQSSNGTSSNTNNKSESEKTIDSFVKLCNDHKIEEAYNMVSTDCKKVLFPTINYFRNNYYNKVFAKTRTAKIETSMYAGNIYKVTYTNDILAQGGYDSSETIQDYIYTVREDEGMKLSFNKFLYAEEINKQNQKDNVSIKILQKKVYIDYEEYKIQIANNSKEKIRASTDQNDVYLLDESGNKYTSNITELSSGATLIESNKTSTIELKFYKRFGTEKNSKLIAFSRIQNDKLNEEETNIIQIGVNM